MKIKRRTLQQIRKWFFIFLGIGLITFLWFGYFRTDFFLITTYNIEGVTDEERSEITPILAEEAKKYTWKIFPHNRLLTYSNESIMGVIATVVPEAGNIQIRPKGLHTLEIGVTKHEPVFRTESGKGVTGGGIIFSTRKDISSYPILSVASSTISSVEINDLIFSKFSIEENLLKDMQDFGTKISDVIFPVAAITIDLNRDISFIDSRGVSRVLITEDTDMKKAWSTLVSAIDTDPLKTKLKESISLLEYLDIRFGNKVFYKFSDKSLVTASAPVIIENHDQASTTVSE